MNSSEIKALLWERDSTSKDNNPSQNNSVVIAVKDPAQSITLKVVSHLDGTMICGLVISALGITFALGDILPDPVFDVVNGILGNSNTTLNGLKLKIANTVVIESDGSATFHSVSTPEGTGIDASGAASFTTLNIGGPLENFGIQILGAQQAAIPDSTGPLDVVATVNAMLAAMRAHGLIAT